MHGAAALRLVRFGAKQDPLVALDATHGSNQVKYLRCYLHDLGARTVLVEPNYFDRDYLSEFVAFYSTSAAGYPNVCQRLHVFACSVTRAQLEQAAGGDRSAQARLQDAYLGHIILRPLPDAPIGRTVLKTYPDEIGEAQGTPRVMGPARWYEAHVAGLTWRVLGLAWQQQETAVGSCATVALWSMLHSSAFDDHHAIPTTAEITTAAQRALPDGSRVFPAADGMRIEQMLEVVKQHGLAPLTISGDTAEGFSRARFCTLVGAFLRSGYPILVNGLVDDQPRSGHAVCIVGFRSPALVSVPSGKVVRADSNIDHLYIHDDNLGPNARFRVETFEGNSGETVVQLRAEAPHPTHGALPTTNPTVHYEPIIPTDIVVAVHPELRTAPEALQNAAMEYAGWLPEVLDHQLSEQGHKGASGMLVSSRFIRLVDYVDRELASALDGRPTALWRARLGLWETVPPMSLHIGLVRVSLRTQPLVDILFDTSDSDRHLRPKAHIAFHEQVTWLHKRWSQLTGSVVGLGQLVRAW